MVTALEGLLAVLTLWAVFAPFLVGGWLVVRSRRRWQAAEQVALWEPHTMPAHEWAGPQAGQRQVTVVQVRRVARRDGQARAFQPTELARLDPRTNGYAEELRAATDRARQIAETLNTTTYGPPTL
jgi:hypothetical protein